MKITGTTTQSNGLHNIDIARAAAYRIQDDARITKQAWVAQQQAKHDYTVARVFGVVVALVPVIVIAYIVLH